MPDQVTRRKLIGAAGTAAAASALLAPGPASAQRASRRGALELIGRLNQEGTAMTGFGYVTHLLGVEDDRLFREDAHTEATARLTFAASATITSRSQLDTLFTGAAGGQLDIHLSAGASFDDPASFSRGRRVARFDARFFNVLAVQSPNTAVMTLHGELGLRSAASFSLAGRSRRIAARGQTAELEAFGNGTRTDATLPRATFVVGVRIELDED